MTMIRIVVGVDPTTKQPIFATVHPGLSMKHVRNYKVPGPVKQGVHVTAKTKRGVPCTYYPNCEWRPTRAQLRKAKHHEAEQTAS